MTQPSETAANNPDRISPGMRLVDRYVVQEVVGYGGMATVYRGRDTLLDREVAIKVLHQRLANDEGDRSAFLREARTAASLSHPGIVGTYDAGVFTGWPYIIMEYVPGGSLKDIIDTRAPLPSDEAVSIAILLAEALEYGHRRGLVHCDVKPQNVLLDADGQPKIVDFGISQTIAATVALTTSVTGTAGYVAPEQLEGMSLDGRADVYSLGTVFYQMLSGVLPFQAPTLTALATARLATEPRPLRDANPAVPASLATIVMRCLSRNREARFASAGELAAVLRSFREGGSVADTASFAAPLAPIDATQAWRRPTVQARSAPDEAFFQRSYFWPVAVLMAVLLAALIAILVVVVPARSGGTHTVAVPQVVNARIDDAARALHDAGLNVTVQTAVSDQPVGTVLSQDPAPPTTLSTRSSVTLTVSQGRGP